MYSDTVDGMYAYVHFIRNIPISAHICSYLISQSCDSSTVQKKEIMRGCRSEASVNVHISTRLEKRCDLCGLLVADGLVPVFQKRLLHWECDTRRSLDFTQNGGGGGGGGVGVGDPTCGV